MSQLLTLMNYYSNHGNPDFKEISEYNTQLVCQCEVILSHPKNEEQNEGASRE